MSTTSNATVLHETTAGVETRQQVYELVRTYEVLSPVDDAPGVRNKIRVTVHADDYVSHGQSRYFAQLWTPGGWVEIVRIDGADPAFTGTDRSGNLRPRVSGYDTGSNQKRDFLDEVAAELLARAVAVLS